jgi:hypothetical protein
MKALLLSKKMSIRNGRSIYSDYSHELLVGTVSDLTLLKEAPPDSYLKRRKYWKLLFLVFLLPNTWSESFYIRKQWYRSISKYKEEYFDFIFVDHFQLWWLFFFLRNKFKKSKIILISHNLEYRARLSYVRYGSFIQKIIALPEIIPLYLWEKLLTRKSDGIIAISSYEAAFYQKKQKNTIVIYPEFKPFKNNYYEEVNQQYLLLVGSYGYKAKELNALWLMQSVMPILHEKNRSVLLRIVGIGVTPKMRKVAAKMSNVQIIGYANSLDDYYNTSKIVLIPEKMGGGFKLKLLEACSYYKPIVIDQEAVLGTVFNDNEDCLVFTTAEECAKSVLRLLEDNDLCEALALNAYRKSIDYHLKERATQVLDDYLGSLIA